MQEIAVKFSLSHILEFGEKRLYNMLKVWDSHVWKISSHRSAT